MADPEEGEEDVEALEEVPVPPVPAPPPPGGAPPPPEYGPGVYLGW